MRPVAGLLAMVLLVACGGGGGAPGTTDVLRRPALEYAASAERALAGTRFESVAPSVIAGALLDVCRGATVAAAVAALTAPPGPAEDDDIVAEVLEVGVSEVCPGQTPADPGPAYLAAVDAAVAASGGDPIDPVTAARVGVSACRALATSDPGAVLALVLRETAGLEVTATGIRDGEVGPGAAATGAAVLAAAAVHLCPQHAGAVASYLGELASPR